MPEDIRHTKLAPIVGIFVLGALASLILITFSLKQIILSGRTYDLPVYFEKISGLEVGAPVKVYGFNAGQVKSISYSPSDHPVEVILQVHKDVKIYKNAVVTITTVGLIGDTIIEIAAGDPRSGEAKELIGETPFEFQDLAKNTPPIINNIKDILEYVQWIISNDENQRAFTNSLRNMDKLTSELLVLVTDNRQSVSRSIQNVEQLTSSWNNASNDIIMRTKKLDQSLTKSLEKFDRAVDNLTVYASSSADSFTTALAELKLTSASVREFVDKNSDSMDSILFAMRDDLEKVSALLDSLERQEGTLGRAIKNPQAWIELEATLKRLNEILGASSQSFRLPLEYTDSAPPAP